MKPAGCVPLRLVPVTVRDAAAFILEHHRHHLPDRGHLFVLGIATGDELVGVAAVGRPKPRAYQDGLTAEVTRSCCRDGYPNANSMLYGAAWRAARAMGYLRLVTYTQAGESGASLRGAGWRVVAERPARAGWRDSSGQANPLRNLRAPVGAGGVQRTLWEIGA